MKAVVNTTPLISFALLHRLSLLEEIFGEVIVPQAVHEEVVKAGTGKPGADALAEAKWLQVVTLDVAITIEPLLLGLDAGELAVLLGSKRKGSHESRRGIGWRR